MDRQNLALHTQAVLPRIIHPRKAKGGAQAAAESIDHLRRYVELLFRRPTEGERMMRFMVIVKATKSSEAGVMPGAQLLADMGKFNQELMEAGVMLDGAGVQSSSKGARVTFSGKDRAVTWGRSRTLTISFPDTGFGN